MLLAFLAGFSGCRLTVLALAAASACEPVNHCLAQSACWVRSLAQHNGRHWLAWPHGPQA